MNSFSNKEFAVAAIKDAECLSATQPVTHCSQFGMSIKGAYERQKNACGTLLPHANIQAIPVALRRHRAPLDRDRRRSIYIVTNNRSMAIIAIIFEVA